MAHKNILVFMIDDMGYNDLHSFSTPTIEKLSLNGIILKNHYTAITCTPSRASFLTGKYPVNTGLTSALLYNNPYGLSNHTTLPQILKENNYKTSLIGKWHLGYAKKEYLPNNNGFDNFYGMLNGASDHYTKKIKNVYDLHHNEIPIQNDKYSTELYTEKTLDYLEEPFFTMVSYQALHTPLQVPKKYLRKCKMKNKFRKMYCGMMIAVDKSIKKITDKLKKDNTWNNTLVLFLSDNGGQPFYGASNYPYRGSKNSVFEGGTRGIAFLSGGVIKKSFKYEGLIHISDWLPSFLSYVNVNNNYEIDGIDLFYNIVNNKKSNRNEMLIHYDTFSNSFCYRQGKWKIIVGNTGDSSLFGIYDSKICSFNELPIDKLVCFFNHVLADKYFFLSEIIKEFRNVIKKNSIGGNVLINRNKIDKILLYNLDIDPYELNDLSEIYPNKTYKLLQKLNMSFVKSEQYPWFIADNNAKHKLHNGRLYYYPWINDGHEVDEYNFVRYFVFKILLTNIMLLMTCCFLVRLLYKRIFTPSYK